MPASGLADSLRSHSLSMHDGLLAVVLLVLLDYFGARGIGEVFDMRRSDANRPCWLDDKEGPRHVAVSNRHVRERARLGTV